MNARELSRIGLGTWSIGGSGWPGGWGEQDSADSLATIHAALDHGVNWLDTSPLYGRGRAEMIIGQALAQRTNSRSLVQIATKCGWPWVGRRKRPVARLTGASIRDELNSSLRRLRTDRVDLYQIHHPTPAGQLEEGWEELARQRERGIIGAAGICNCTVSDLERLSSIAPVSTVQIPYNLLQRDAEETLLPYCRRHGIAVLASSPLQNGMLTTRFDRKRVAQLPGNDWRRHHPNFQEPRLSSYLEVIQDLRAAVENQPLARIALGWVLAQPGVHAAILGARLPHQINEALRPWPNLDEDNVASLITAKLRSHPLASLRSSPHESEPSR